MSASNSNGSPRQADDIRQRLQQAARGLAQAPRSAAARDQRAAPVDEPWDLQAAEALTSLYDDVRPAPVARPQPRPAAPPPARPAAPARIEAPAVVQPGVEPAWLEERLSDLSRRVETALAAASPAEGLKALDGRLDRVETRLGTALEGIEKLPKREALAAIETQLTALRRHQAAADKQLGRLEGIETQLRALDEVARAAPAKLFEAAPTPALDIDALVQRLSTHLAGERAASPQVVPDHEAGLAAQAQSLGELRTVVDHFIAQQRDVQAHTASTLSTMQEALIRLIDRIEEVGEAAEDDVVDGTPASEQRDPAPRYEVVEDERAPSPGRRASDIAAAAAAKMAPAARAETPVPAETVKPAPAQGATEPLPTPPARVAAPAAPAPAKRSNADADAVAIERARVAAARATTAHAGTSAPAVTRTPAARAAAPGASKSTERPSRPLVGAPAAASVGQTSVAQRGLRIAGIAALLIGVSTASFMAVDRFGRYSSSSEAPRPIAETPTSPEATSKANAVAVPSVPAGAVPASAPRALDRPGMILEFPQAIDARPGEPAAPAPAPRPRSVPETVTEDLSQGPRGDAPWLASTAAGRPGHAGMTGIILDGPAGIDQAADLARRLAPPTAPSAAAAAPTAMRANAALPDADPSVTSATAHRPVLIEMPPAQIGPTSLRLAAQQGDPAAQFEVASRFAEAKGIKQDFEQAFAWYQRAARQGFVPAQYRLATLIERGLGTPPDPAQAKAWYRRAADQGNVKAMHNLAVLATTETPDQPDYATAARWFVQAAERGLADSQYNLAVLHDNGLGVPKDFMQAYKWYALAARGGDKEAIKRRDQIFASLTPGQTRDAEKLVSTWRSRTVEQRANDPRAAALAWKAEQDQLRAKMDQLAAEAAARQAQQPPAAPQPAAAAAQPAPKVVRASGITTKTQPTPVPLRP